MGKNKRPREEEEGEEVEEKDATIFKEKYTGNDGEMMIVETFEQARNVFPEGSRAIFDACTSSFKVPSPIQSKTWMPLLRGMDVIGIAATGSGKTLAFVLPAVAMLLDDRLGSRTEKQGRPRILVLSPTRELCMQSFEVAKSACKSVDLNAVMVYGGQPKHQQKKELRAVVDILVATPGRLLDFLEEEVISLKKTRFLVLDEADRMLDMGFEKDIRAIIGKCSEKRQTVMFSATWPEEIRKVASEFLKESAFKVVLSGEKLQASKSVTQRVEVMSQDDKENRLLEILAEYKKKKIIVFALYKKEAERLEQMLSRKRFSVVGVHGDKSQPKREEAVALFTNGSAEILVATDVAARGLDIKGVELVVNYTFPLTIEDYVHRIGRTGRAGAFGDAITFFTEHDKLRAGELQNVLRQANVPIPPELLAFGSTVKKKQHSLYGAHFKVDPELASKAPTRITFNDDDDE